VVLTPGIYNSAYFEHAFLAQGMGAELVEGATCSSTTTTASTCARRRPVRVDVIYRRIDEDFMDPEAFREDSVLGVAGLMRAWRAGKVAIANAPGAGVADDKVVYAFVPEMIRYYLREKPLMRSVPTYLCMPRERSRVRAREYRATWSSSRRTNPAATASWSVRTRPGDASQVRRLIEKNPRNYIAQPTLACRRRRPDRR
jgi:uncharacterized circularly permuted ATP-grasp superfamily protein